MVKTREIVCEYYICEGSCSKGREGTFTKCCQTCNKYKKKPGAAPRRTDNRSRKLKKIKNKELIRAIKEY